ncbi:conserved exported protein of unknown function [Shewanella benthica]|uniref:DUF3718 domain-containing protein n=1 Tax=Shewanella benthica TaxID=43661 RepID=A0A330M7V0_9GAMM|nr:DUF3718 domain-containing protein [Shewanella benthica]SQH78182.1 conserved exported protein of unknown function [Shewanella benthica]
MRLLPTSIAAIIVVSSSSMPVQANSDQLAANICNYVQTNDKNRLRKKLKENRVKLRNIYSAVTCDGNSLLRTAMKNGSDKVGTFIAKRLAVSELTAAEADGKTITDWAEANGHGASAITAAIKKRTAGS